MSDFVLQTTEWYRLNMRDLPWRKSSDPYFIWLSEVILQQTRVDQGLNYFLKFTTTFPTIEQLAAASEEEVLKLWQGLGYYSRARNLHHAAKEIVSKYHGKFPNSYVDILALKGVGEYTAAAISSICFGHPKAVVDGNVYRVLSRYFGIDQAIDSTVGKKTFQELADSLVPILNPGEYNQAIMEFGALQCKPTNPNCGSCVLVNSCASNLNPELIAKRPFKQGKTKQTKRYFHYLIWQKDSQIAINKRTSKGIWQHLYEFPLIETETSESSLFQNETPLFKTTHILSHQQIVATFYQINNIADYPVTYELVDFNHLENLPLHRLMEKFIESAKKNNQITF